ncbi:MAG: SusC/RagA family TonB-linked outer membrane protein [Bacteroidales bacterium]|nr:SusC/RagA family TonB-linked outer membrane protein [Bacteroidales bacterium]
MKNTGKIYSLIVVLLLATATVFAQEKTLIRGTVVSAIDREPIIGATVMEINNDNRVLSSTATNLDGNFSLLVSSKANKLTISYVGYKKLEIPIGNNNDLKIALQERGQLQEVVVSATQKQRVGSMDIDERDISMAISKLSAEEIADLNVASVDEALQGRLAGVDIMANAGDPGSGMTIRIRGITSISGNNQPMIVVDGIPLETEIGADFDFSTATEEEFSQLLNVAPSDIKDIVVLKDAAATAIWGSKAANGVLQITTKRGSISPPKITFVAKGGLLPQAASIPTLSGNEYSTMILESYMNTGKPLDLLSVTGKPFSYDPRDPYTFYNYNNNTDWVKAISRTGYTQDYNLSVRGGSSKVRYSFSAGFYNTEGNTIGTALSRINTRLNLDYYVSDQIRFSADIAYTHSENQRNLLPNGDERNDVRSRAYTMMPNQGIYEYNEKGVQMPTYFTPLNGPQGSYPAVFNPVALANLGDFNITSEKIIPHLQVQIKPNETWRYTFDVGFDVGNDRKEKFLTSTASGVNWYDNKYFNEASLAEPESFVIQTINRLYFTPKLDDTKHRLIALLGTNTYSRESYSFGVATAGSPSNYLTDPVNYYILDNELTSGVGQQRTMSALANVNYTYLDRYTIYGNLSLNGDSRFGKNYRYGLFPALSGRWRVSGEPWMSGFKGNWLDDFSLRASYGITGKSPDADYLYFNRYSSYSYGYLGEATSYPSSLELKELRWERSLQNNFGLNFVALDYKLNLEFDYYIRVTKDQYSSRTSIPTSSGFSTMALNFGTLRNEGWELNLNYTPVKTKDWNVNVAFNMAREQNSVTELSEYADLDNFEDWSSNGAYITRLVAGQPRGAFYGYKYQGVYLNRDQTIAIGKDGKQIMTTDGSGNQVPVYMKFGYPTLEYTFQPGDAKYEDINKDGQINYQDIVYLGDYNPLIYGGITPSVKYKNWSLSTVFHYRYGNDIVNAARMSLENMYGFNNQATSVLRRWRHEYANPDDAPKDLLPRALHAEGYNWLASDRFVEDGSFIRWKSITLRYNFPRPFLSRFKLQDTYLYFTMQNVLLLTNYTGQDPEIRLGTFQDNARTPVPKSYTLGMSVSF